MRRENELEPQKEKVRFTCYADGMKAMPTILLTYKLCCVIALDVIETRLTGMQRPRKMLVVSVKRNDKRYVGMKFEDP